MTVKLRPGTHYVAVERGVLIAQRQTSFVLGGPAAALYQLLDDSLGMLLDGTDAAALTQAAGNPAAAPVFEHIIATLLDKDVLFDVRAGSAAPDPADALRYARTLSYCEAQCSDPYGAFAAVRAARIAVLGSGPAVDAVARALVEIGVGTVDRDGSRPADAGLAVLVSDSTLRPAVTGPLPAHVLPVLAGPEVAVIGPLAAGSVADRMASLDWTAALARRAARWAQADPAEMAAAPLSAALAGSLAARTVLDQLLGLATEPEPAATVVHGRLLRTTTLARPATRSGIEAAPRAPGTSSGTADPADRTGPTAPAGELLARIASLTSPLCGPIRRGADEDLVQLPLCLASAQVVDVPGAPVAVLGWGTDRGSAGLDAVLRACRAWTSARHAPSGAGGAASATAVGLSSDWAELDGRLRVLGAELLAGSAGSAVSWSQLAASRPRALWSLVEEHYGQPVRMRARTLGAGPWTLVSLVDDGDQVVNHWGYSVESAAFGALGQYAAQLQGSTVQARALAAEPIGTQVLSWASPQQLAAGLAATAGSARRDWQVEWAAADEVSGPLPLHAGLVWAC